MLFFCFFRVLFSASDRSRLSCIFISASPIFFSIFTISVVRIKYKHITVVRKHFATTYCDVLLVRSVVRNWRLRFLTIIVSVSYGETYFYILPHWKYNKQSDIQRVKNNNNTSVKKKKEKKRFYVEMSVFASRSSFLVVRTAKYRLGSSNNSKLVGYFLFFFYGNAFQFLITTKRTIIHRLLEYWQTLIVQKKGSDSVDYFQTTIYKQSISERKIKGKCSIFFFLILP